MTTTATLWAAILIFFQAAMAAQVDPQCIQSEQKLMEEKILSASQEVVEAARKSYAAKVVSHDRMNHTTRLQVNVEGTQFVVDVLTDTDGAVLDRNEVSRKMLDPNALLSADSGTVSAAIHVGAEGSHFLTVETSDNYSVVDLVGVHGKVLTDDTYGTLKISPNQSYLVYTAESLAEDEFEYVGSFGEAVRPVMVLYNIVNQTFRVLDQVIPAGYSAGGDVTWGDSKTLLGVAWPNHPVPLGCPRCTNRHNRLFKVCIEHDTFKFLSPEVHGDHEHPSHVESPVYDNGHVYFLENRIHQSGFLFATGDFKNAARRLVRMSLATGNRRVLAENLYLLNPRRGLPPMIIADNVVYISVYHDQSVRLMSVDAESGDCSLHPDLDNVRLLDATSDVLVVEKSSLNLSPTLNIAVIDPYVPTTTTTTTTTTTAVTTVSTVTSSSTTDLMTTSTNSPSDGECEELLQVLETNDIASNEDDEMTKRSKRAVNHSDLAQKKTFWEIALNVSATFRGHYHVETLSFPSLLNQVGSSISDDNTTSDQVENKTSHRFTAILAYPNVDHRVPLLVMVNGGDPPHTTAFEAVANLALRLNLAVLKINWEFNGVPSELQQLMYNNSAIIDPGQLCLWGEGIGGLVAFNWAAEQRGNGVVSHLVLQNPVADLVSLAKYSDVPDVAWQVVSNNRTEADQYEYKLHVESWIDRSPLYKAIEHEAWHSHHGHGQDQPRHPHDHHEHGFIGAPTMMFAGLDNIQVPAEQSIALYTAMKMCPNTDVTLFTYPGEGNVFRRHELHFLTKSFNWLKRAWSNFDGACTVTTNMPTPSSTTSAAGGNSPQTNPTPTNSSSAPSSDEMLKSGLILLGMHAFTLYSWFQLKFLF